MIREDAKGRIYVEGLKSVPITNIDEMLAVLNHGSIIRQTDATAINAKSSRSHAVFTINLRQSKLQPSATTPREKRYSVPMDMMASGESLIAVESKLHFVDLAGSERLKNTGATGDRAKEGISINAGLASLGKVISQLSTRSAGSHVSYRDSKLTRMLQDSLGGNAITYMIACVTPVEFHLSETLNTVQYAQRARNIQSKPKIQQISDDADKQAAIDRLRSEVAFLRQQIRSAEGGDRRNGAHLDRSDRPNEREVELQNSLLDVQESYTALSQRHAKLIAQLTENSEQEASSWNHVAGESAVDRLKRSQANQAQIEQVVLEYEKTIQSLEGNLSTTRSSLAHTESSLLERETKLAYIENMNQQLHTRVQKLMDRESSTEVYLQELEGRLEGHNTGGERNDAIIADLRKEIARVREANANTEDYVTTLEERLADADHDMELMQRELERLDHLVERQRSLGKLDNLLYELDHIQNNGEPASAGSPKAVGVAATSINGTLTGTDRALETLKEAEEVELPAETDDEFSLPQPEVEQVTEAYDADSGLEMLQNDTTPVKARTSRLIQEHESPQPSPAQSKFVAEKFEALSQELFDLRLEHESTVNEYDLLSAKYHKALRTLAEMQNAVDEARLGSPDEIGSPRIISRPTSLSEGARTNELRDGRHVSSSRSLSPESSLAEESAAPTEPSDITPISRQQPSNEVASQEIEKLQLLLAEHEHGLNLVTKQYAELQAEHKEALTTVEALKLEVQRNRPSSPSLTPGMLRRMSSQVVGGVDRGQRSVTSLRAIMSEEYEGRPDRMESIELHLSAANHELQSRFERIQFLEAEAKNVKRELDMKSTIIAGLTRERERSTQKAASPVDLSMVAQMRDQLVQKETDLKSLHDAYTAREQQFQNEIQQLTASKANHEVSAADRQTVTDSDQKLRQLQDQFDKLSEKHQAAEQSAEASMKQLRTVAAELAAALASIETLKAQQEVGSEGDSMFERAAAARAMQNERENFHELVANLKREVDDQRSANTQHTQRMAELEQQHSSAQGLAEQRAKMVASLTAEIATHRSNIDKLERAVEFHKHGLKSLHETHSNAIEEMKLSHSGVMAALDDQIAEMSQNHEKLTTSMKADLEKAKHALQDLVAAAQIAMGHPTTVDMLPNHIQDLIEEKRHIAEANARLVGTNAELERQLTGTKSLEEVEQQLKEAIATISKHQQTIINLATENADHEERLREKETTIQKHTAMIDALNAEKQNKMKMIEDLEQQLQTSYDQHNNRVSLLQAQSSQALVEAQQRIALLEKDIDIRRSVVDSDAASRSNTIRSQHRPHSPVSDGQTRSNSMTSNLRKSASIVSLPTPPPAIPLPPIPSMPAVSVSLPTSVNQPSPPASRHTSKELPLHNPHSTHSASLAISAARHSAILEEKEARIRQLEEQEARLRKTEKHLHAEKQLTTTLEEALVDSETKSNKWRVEAESWKQKAWKVEEELQGLRKERRAGERLSVQAVEDERLKRQEAERAREVLEERMRALNSGGKKKKKGSTLNCF
jgi:chromosome segregation ATPase